MKFVNADYGIDMVPADGRLRKWYRHHKFPLLPMYDYDHGDEWNAPGVYFSWLFVRIWSLSEFSLRASIEFDDAGLRLGFSLPYLRIYLWLIPFPLIIQEWAMKHLYKHKYLLPDYDG